MKAHETEGLDNSPHARRIIQVAVDLRRGSLAGARVLDLGSAHGMYTLECARRGAYSLGLEGRSAWIDQAVATRDSLGLSSAEFAQADVRELSEEHFGRFDVSLCLGLLYHLTAEEAFVLLKKLCKMTDDFLIVDTQFALAPQEDRTLDGRIYSGCEFPEHPVGTSPEDVEGNMGAALDGDHSFWFTLPSLINMLGEVGFTSVLELKWPADHLYKDGAFRVHEDYVTLVAMKGAPMGEMHGAPAPFGLQRMPEDASVFFLERPSRVQIGWLNRRSPTPAEPPTDPERRSLGARLKAGVRAFLG